MRKIISPLTGTLQSIKKQFISKDKLLKSTLNIQKKRITLNRSNAERERFIDYEKVLERPLRSLGTGVKNVVGKRLGFLDTLKTFIVNLLLGFITLKLLKYLPQLMQFASVALKVGNFILDIGGKILNGIVTFVDYGYKAYDHARKIVGKVGGEKAIASLDKATDESTKVMNQLFIAAMLFSDFSPFASMGSAPAVFNKSVDAIKDKVSGEVATAAADVATKTAGSAALGPLATAGVVAGAGLLLSAAGEGVFQLTKWAKGLIGFGPVSKFFQAPLSILEGVGTIFDILGAPFRYGIELIRAGFMKMFNMKDGLEKQAKNLGKFDARVRENIRRFAGIFAPVFTFFGQNETAKNLATPGSFGSLYGKKAVKDMGYSGGGKVISVRKYAAGGSVNIPRTEVKKVDIPRNENIKKKSAKAGASIGGGNSFADVFPKASKNDEMNRYGYMIDSYNTISGIPDLGSVFALTTKTLLGDNVTKDDYDRASGSLRIFMLLGLSKTNPRAYQKFSSLIDIGQFERVISQFLMKSMNIPLEGIINLLKVQVGLIPKPGEESEETKSGEEGGDGVEGEFSVSGGNADFWSLVAVASREDGDPQGQADVAQSIYNRVASGVYDANTIKGIVTASGQYEPTFKNTADWKAITDIKSASIAAGKSESELKKVAAAITNKKYQDAAREFVGGRTDFMGGSNKPGPGDKRRQENSPNNFFGWFVGPAARAYGKTNPGPATVPKLGDIVVMGGGTSRSRNSAIPSGDPGNVKSAGATAGGNISGYPVTSGFGPRVDPISGQVGKKHGGVDISAPPGKPIGLTVDAIAGPPPQFERGYGNFMDIQIPSLNLYFRMAHFIKPPNYKPGEKIPAGKIIANVGSTGRSTGDHIHFEVNKVISGYGGDRDPMPYGKYLTIGRESGGATFSGGIRQLHKGEYVIDKDSVGLFGGDPFFRMINGVENKKQRSEKSSQLIQHLSKYTERKIDQRPEMIVASDPIIIQGPPTYFAPKSYGGSSGGSSFNYEQDMLELRA